VSSDPNRPQIWARALSVRLQALILLVLAFAASAGIWVAKSRPNSDPRQSDAVVSSRPGGVFYPTAAEMATLTIEPVQKRVFRAEHVTEGKIAVDEDRSTPIFSPYAGRITKLFVRPGDTVTVGQPLFTVEATDMVQAQNDFITTATALNKARSALNLAQIIDKRQRLLYEGKAVPLKEVQNARAALDAAENDLRSADVALEATRNRLRILGKTDQEITAFQEKGAISPATVINAPIAGTIVQRKVGPGQYVGSNTIDPVFIIGDLSTVWVIAYIRESEAPTVHTGQAIYFTVLSTVK
jgi:cobalt-zinc-cadmium efflux system membrane fusion protein